VNVDDKETCMRLIKVRKDEKLIMLNLKTNKLLNECEATDHAKKIQDD
jgi:hypothetical protein